MGLMEIKKKAPKLGSLGAIFVIVGEFSFADFIVSPSLYLPPTLASVIIT
jgi:hypothetical protein